MSAHLHPRLAVAASAAPVSGTVLAALAITSWMGCIDEVCFPATAGFGATYGGFAGIVLGWPLMLMLGLPVHTWLLRHGRTAALAYLFAGAVIGVAGAAGLQGLIWLASTGASLSPGSAFAFGAGSGAIAGLAFWLIRRPDRDSAANPPTSPA